MKKFTELLQERFSAFKALVTKTVAAGNGGFSIGGVTFTVAPAGNQLEDIGWYVINGQKVSLCDRRADRLACAAAGFLGADLVRGAEDRIRLKTDDEARRRPSLDRKQSKLHKLEKLWGAVRAARLWSLRKSSEAMQPIVVKATIMVLESGAPVDKTDKEARAVCRKLPRLSRSVWTRVQELASLLAEKKQ